jgi:tripartite-type tricarboxylate transporter receptor subunit TctC
LLLTLVLAGLSCAASAQQSGKPLTLVVPFAPGGGSDTSARLLSQALASRLGQTVVIENKPGAAGVIGADQVARAPADGNAILLGNIGTQSINPILYKKLPYDAKTAFAPVSLVAELPQVLLVHPGVQAKDVAGLIALLKAQPGKFSYSTSGLAAPCTWPARCSRAPPRPISSMWPTEVAGRPSWTCCPAMCRSRLPPCSKAWVTSRPASCALWP